MGPKALRSRVADARASTPSSAAALALPDRGASHLRKAWTLIDTDDAEKFRRQVFTTVVEGLERAGKFDEVAALKQAHPDLAR